MCGIAGYIGPHALAPDRTQACLDRMRRRGPDAAATYHHSMGDGHHVHLLHSRLSIIDLEERSNQPFRIGPQVLVFNGELYNYVEVRAHLRAKRSFATEGDTEVLMGLLVEEGWPGLDRCEGMWAFAVYDERDGSLLLSRDRFGEKPLYLLPQDGGWYFGSEVKFIAALAGKSLGVNYDHIYRYLVNGYKSLYKTPATFFEGLREVRAGHVLSVDRLFQTTETPYWRPSFEQEEGMTYGEAVHGVRERLIESMKLRLRADVPLAFCLSGGIDSTALISIAKSELDYDVHGFTIVNEDARYEEKEFVDHTVGELGIRHTAVPVSTQNFLDRLRTLVVYHDAPVYTISYYVHWLLMERVHAEGYRISVSGTAADELLSGYYDHHNLYHYELRESPHLEAAIAGWKANVRPYVRNPYLQQPKLYFDDPGIRDHVYLRNVELAEFLIDEWWEPFEEQEYTGSLMRNRMLNELFQEAVPVILHEDDLNAMYYSIENRSPYLDRHLFEFSLRIPTQFLVRDGLAKVVLRDAMESIAPRKVLWNPRKVGFNAPVFSFLDVKDPQVKDWLLGTSPIYQHVRRDKIEDLIQQEDLPNSASKFLFYFVCSKMFLEEFGVL